MFGQEVGSSKTDTGGLLVLQLSKLRKMFYYYNIALFTIPVETGFNLIVLPCVV